MPSPVKLQFQSLIQSAFVETTAKVEVLGNKILHCTISQILTLFTKTKMTINWIKGKWDNANIHCKKYSLVMLKPAGTYRVLWKRYHIELLHLKLCLLRNMCAITRKMEGMNNYEHMKKKLSHQRNGHYERSTETNWRRSQKLRLLHSVSEVMKIDFPVKSPYLPFMPLSCACVKNEYLLNTDSGALYPPTSSAFLSLVPRSCRVLHSNILYNNVPLKNLFFFSQPFFDFWLISYVIALINHHTTSPFNQLLMWWFFLSFSTQFTATYNI